MARTASEKSKLPDYETSRDALNVEGKAERITEANFGYLFRCYASYHGQNDKRMGVNINPIDHASQWGAWRAWRVHKGMPVYAMNQIGQRLAQMRKLDRQAAVGFLVPCDWPADFDADYSPENDRYAAEKFVFAQNRKREEVAQMQAMTQDDRQRHITEALQRFHATVGREGNE